MNKKLKEYNSSISVKKHQVPFGCNFEADIIINNNIYTITFNDTKVFARIYYCITNSIDIMYAISKYIVIRRPGLLSSPTIIQE